MDFKLLLDRAIENSPKNENGKRSIEDIVYQAYRLYIEFTYPNMVSYWPAISGADYKIGMFNKFYIVILIDKGPSSIEQCMEVGNIYLPLSIKEQDNPELIRREVFKIFNLKNRDAIFIIDTSNQCNNFPSDLERDLKANFIQHKMVMNMQPIKIFLSHKSADKEKVRNFKSILELLGFSPWLDEDAMSAGANLERSLLKGMSDSCAAIFFITPEYKDEKYLASEIDYAIKRKRDDGDKFSIITLVFQNEKGQKGIVPELLKSYVWKEPNNDLNALNEILRALPLEVGNIRFKSS